MADWHPCKYPTAWLVKELATGKVMDAKNGKEYGKEKEEPQKME